ncbi:hypothetical protein GCM10011369_32610 [Neiella marina]|uniref:DUF3293 domain-containing protein n=1 Tax=Neiella marina TaxID=508461 RepID=A0A8J2U989_9GAMM|nr:DUF3293 domain-containing protein [Neiella marina]GGA87981.1 hypothetical protein GCM10011369_32610 [Neiella marina]
MKTTWQLYSDTVFWVLQTLPEHVSGFIVTAHNPLGRLCEPAANRLADNLLLAELEQRQHRFRRIIGCSPDLTHQEAGWFVFADLNEGIRLAKCFEQNAVYWVEQGELSLHPCLLTQHQNTALGQLSHRLWLAT